MISIHLFITLFLLSQAPQRATSDDPLLIVDPQETAETTRLPNAHSAAFVMGFIFLCLFAYGAYRACRGHCGAVKQPLTVNLEGGSLEELGVGGLEDYVKEREEYLAIYGPKVNAGRDKHVCEFKQREEVVIGSRQVN